MRHETMADDDLYDDLDDSKLPASFSSPKKQQYLVSSDERKSSVSTASNHNRPKSLAEQVNYLQEQVNRLCAENTTLQRNMGTLYRTAVLEIARKDAEIARLQQENLASAIQP
jgi:hypothetical protein